jgi:thiamine biosynthesis lipoprotein
VNRRDLLRGLRRADAARPAPERPVAGAGALLRASRPAMGSFFEVQVPAATPGGLALVERALDRVEAIEGRLTIYRDDSEVSRVNATAHLGPVEVSPELFALIEEALAVGNATSGAYDVASGALSIAWGFVRGPKRVPTAEALAEARARSGMSHVRLDSERRTVVFDVPGVVLNFGAIGKGYAVDAAAAELKGWIWPAPGLVHSAQSSLYAVGAPPGRFGGRWPIALRNPSDPERPLGTIWLRNRGLGTSGGAFQWFEGPDGRRYGHILDPRTGEPTQGIARSVTVLAPTAARADALSTAFHLLGPEGAVAYRAAGHPEVSAIFVEEEGGVVTVGVAPEDFEAAEGTFVRTVQGAGPVET